MALTLSAKAQLLSQKTNIENQIIFKIDGIPLCFGAIAVTELVRYDGGSSYDDPGIFYDGVIESEESRDWISLDGTTTRIKQQITPDKASSISVQKVNIKLIDKDGELTNLFSPGIQVEDILARDAQVWVNFKGGAHPEDSIRIISGVVDNAEFGAGFVKITVAHPEQLKRTELFTKITDELSASIGALDSVIPLTDATGLIEPQDALRTAIRIDDEIIEYTGISGNNLTGVTRGILGTVASSHDIGNEVETFYILEGGPIDLALKLMLSNNGNTAYDDDTPVNSFVQIDPSLTVDNAVFVGSTTIQNELGFVPGDLISTSGATEAANNFTDRSIVQVTQVATGTIIVVDGAPLTIETDSSAIISVKSKYNVLPVGAQLSPKTVDVERHEYWNDLFPTSFPDYTIYIRDSITAKEFINEQLYFPAGLFAVPRDGKASLNFSIPPIADQKTKFITSDNVKNPDKLVIKRSTNENFYNAVLYKIEEDSLEEDKYLFNNLTFSQRSVNRINTVNRPLKIESKGLRNNAETFNIIQRQTRRFLDRYQFAAETITIDVLYKTGFNIEVGDIVVFGDQDLKISDINQGNRNFQPRLMEVLNKELDIKTGRVKLELINSAFGIDGRYGTFSPTSLVGAGATTTRIPLKKSFGTPDNEQENFKWQQYINETIVINNPDFSINEETRFLGFEASNPNTMIVEPLSFAPSEDLYVNAPQYPEIDPDPSTNFLWKSLHCFTTFEAIITNGSSNTAFDVSPADIGKFFEDALIRVRNDDFTRDSSPTEDIDDAVIVDITGNTITVDRDLGFTPISGDIVNLTGFVSDEGLPYRYV